MAKKEKQPKQQEAKGAADYTDTLNALRSLADQIDSASILEDETIDYGYFDTGNLAINFAISGKWFDGGVPRGRVTEIIGPSSACKTGLLTHIMVGCQKNYGVCVLKDSEGAYSPKFAQRLGLNLKGVMYSKPKTIEEAFDGMIDYSQKIIANPKLHGVDVLLAYDSIAASPSQKEFEETVVKKEDNAAEMGLRARIASQKLRIMQSFLNQCSGFVTVAVVNQIRMKTGVIFGNPETQGGGGRSLEYYGSVRVDMRRTKKIQKPGIKAPQGIFLKIKTIKNKVANPFIEADDVAFYFDYGVDPISGLISVGQFTGEIVSPKANHFAFKAAPDKMFRKKDLADFLVGNPELIGAPNSGAVEAYLEKSIDALKATQSNAYEVVDAEEEEEETGRAGGGKVSGPPIFSETGSEDDQ